MKKFVFALLLIFGFNSAFADVFDNPEKLENILNRIPKPESIKCKFRQEKYLPNLKKPLISGGDFEFIENKGIYFHTKYPVENKSDYTNTGYKQINSIIQAIQTGKYYKIEKEFDFYYTGNAQNWSLGMKPKKTSDSYDYISSVSLKGANYINNINIIQKNGNKISIWFEK